MKPVRFGILGVAEIARNMLIPAIKQVQGAECVAIASRRPGAASEAAADMGIPMAFDSYESLVASPDVDAVYVPAANGQHRALTELAAAHGKHILCEKPLSVSAQDAEAMIAAANQADVRLMEAFAYYFHPQHRRVLEMIREGLIGEPNHFRARLTFPFPQWDEHGRLNVRFDPEAGGAGVLLDHGCYAVHTARRIFGTEPVAVLAHSLYSPQGVDLSTTVVMEFTGNRLAILDLRLDTWVSLDYEVLGWNGSIGVPHGYGRYRPGHEFPIHLWKRGGSRSTETLPYLDPAIPMVEHFAELVRRPELTPFISHAESLAVARVLDAAALSASTGKRVAL